MYVVTYKLINSERIKRKLHIGDHKDSIRKSAHQKLISHFRDDNWKRFRPKKRSFKVVIVHKKTGKIFKEAKKSYNINYGFVHNDIFFNKKEQKFCLGNDLDDCLSMKDYTCKYVRIHCSLRKK